MKKSKFIVALAVLMMLVMVVPAMAETVRLAYKGGALYIREGAGTQYDAVGTVHNGDKISVLKYGSVWSKIKQKSTGKVGYIKNLYIDDGDTDYAAGTTYFDGGRTMYTTAAVNFRAGASTSTAVMGTFSKGTKLTALGKNGNFYLVKNSKGTQGYVSGTYLSKNKPYGSSSSGSSSSEITRTVTGAYVNIREDGGMSAPVLAVVKKGTVVTQLYRGNYWTKINYRGLVGWIKNTYLR